METLNNENRVVLIATNYHELERRLNEKPIRGYDNSYIVEIKTLDDLEFCAKLYDKYSRKEWLDVFINNFWETVSAGRQYMMVLNDAEYKAWRRMTKWCLRALHLELMSEINNNIKITVSEVK